MRLTPKALCQEWVAIALFVQVFLTCGLLYLYSSHGMVGDGSFLKPVNCVDKSVRYNLHLSAEKPTGGGGRDKQVIEQIIETHDVKQAEFLQDSETKRDPKTEGSARESPQIASVDPMTGQLDKSRQFKTYMHAVVGSDWADLSSNRKVCLGAQTSLDRLYSLADTVQEWSGPISISLFVSDVEYTAALVYLEALRDCFPEVKKQVAFHFTDPTKRPLKYTLELHNLLRGYLENKLSEEGSKEVTLRCQALVGKDVASDLIRWAVQKTYKAKEGNDFTDWRRTMAYPQNLLRNLAKAGCQTEYTMVPDIDMIPNTGLDLMLEKFIRNRKTPASCIKKKCAFVLPVYEISDEVADLPSQKGELLSLIKSGKARGFHEKLFKLNSQSSNLPRWEKLGPGTEGALGVGYEVTKQYKFRYEPVYIAKADTPPFDERFIGFGMTRNTQAYEMFVAGYRFFVLDNGFASHWGFQTIKTRPDFRARQQEANNKKFDNFARELVAKYNGADPYNMMKKLKKLNLGGIKVNYGHKETATTSKPKRS